MFPRLTHIFGILITCAIFVRENNCLLSVEDKE